MSGKKCILLLFLICPLRSFPVQQRLSLKGVVVAINAGHNRATDPRSFRNGDGVGAYSSIGKYKMKFPGNPIAIARGRFRGVIREADLTLDVAGRIGRLCRKLGARVVYTRVEPCVPTPAGRLNNLKKRAAVANRASADLLIDLHANSWQPAGDGFMLFVPVPGKHLGEYRFGPLPAACGRVIHSKKFAGSLDLAHCIRTALVSLAKRGGIRPYPGPACYGSGFKVIGYAAMPAVLLEMGAMDRPRDMDRLAETSYRTLMAERIVDGILKFYLGHRKRL